VVATSFAGLFYRNALNLGLAVLTCPDASRIRAGDVLRIDAEAGRIENETTGDVLACEPIPSHLMEMVRDGGLVPHLEKKLAQQKGNA
jgi:3-isopropylmalate/(R)-2-methylmalate dehydratase small subunit